MSTISAANAPFDHPRADVVLRSSDGVDFHVFKLFLSLASPFFETLFDIPQPKEANEVKDGLAVVPVTEDSKTLDALLRFCYPCTLADDPQLKAFDDMEIVLEAAKKYALDGVEKQIYRAILNPKMIESAPFRCFAIAHWARFEEEKLLAARYSLREPIVPLWFKEIDLLTSTDLLVLLTYHQECGNAVYELKANIGSWIKDRYGSDSDDTAWFSGKHIRKVNPHNKPFYNSCYCPRSPRLGILSSASGPPKWWEDFIDKVFEALQERPCRATVEALAKKTIQEVKARDCMACSPHIAEGMNDFSELLAKKVDNAVSRIHLNFNLQDRI